MEKGAIWDITLLLPLQDKLVSQMGKTEFKALHTHSYYETLVGHRTPIHSTALGYSGLLLAKMSLWFDTIYDNGIHFCGLHYICVIIFLKSHWNIT